MTRDLVTNNPQRAAQAMADALKKVDGGRVEERTKLIKELERVPRDSE